MQAAENTPPDPEASAPSYIQRFRLLEPLGQGGMADVMLAVIPGPARFHKLAVIKTIREDIRSAGQHYAAMFLDEARLAARLNHQNIVHTYEVGEHDGRYFIAMEYLEGQSLREVQRRSTFHGLPLDARIRILIDTANGLHHAHELTDYSGQPLGVVHRDVSPQNIFVTYDGQVKLLDFGIAKAVDAETETHAGSIKGKIDYMAPEQVRGQPVDRRADVFALGAIMWELLADKPLSGGATVSQVTRVHNRVSDQESRILAVMPEVDSELARICDKALAHDADERYPNALEFARDLQGYLSEKSLSPTPEELSRLVSSAFEQERSTMRRRVERALAEVEEDAADSQDPSGPVSTAGPTTPPPGRARRAAQQESAQQQEEAAVPAVRGGRRRLQVLAVMASVAVAAWLGASSGPDDGSSADARGLTPLSAEENAGTARQREAPVDNGPSPVGEATLKVRITSSTPGVSVTLDGATLPRLPFEAKVNNDGTIHYLVATARGYERQSRALVFDRELDVALDLKKARRKRRRRAKQARQAVQVSQPVAPAPVPPAPVAPAEQPGDKIRIDPAPPVKIDEDDPYR